MEFVERVKKAIERRHKFWREWLGADASKQYRMVEDEITSRIMYYIIAEEANEARDCVTSLLLAYLYALLHVIQTEEVGDRT